MVASRGEWVQPGGWPGVRVLVPADEAGVVRAAWAAVAPDLGEAAAGAALLRAVTGQDMDCETIARLSQGASSMKANPVPLSVDTLQAILTNA